MRDFRKISIAVVMMFLFFSPCSATYADDYEYEYYQEEELVKDPFEGYNRSMYKINTTLYRKIVFPITDGYSVITTPTMRLGLSNFFNTILKEPSQLFYSLTQFDGRSALLSSWRFIINNVIGFIGFVDICSDYDFRIGEKSLLQTLNYYGYDNTNDIFIVVPAFGPSTALQSINFILQLTFLKPSFFLKNISMKGNDASILTNRIYLDSNYTNVPGSNYFYFPLFTVNLMTNLRPQLEALEISSFDGYNSMKTQYIGYFNNQIKRENERTKKSKDINNYDQPSIVNLDREQDEFFN
jgi:ABC-type transporter lipoprotein component MlaA